MDTKDVLEAIGGEPDLLAAHGANEEFRNLMTHVTQATNGVKAIQVLCRGYLELLGEVSNVERCPLSLEPAELAEPANPNHP